MLTHRDFLATLGLTAAGAVLQRVGVAATPDGAPSAEVIAQATIGEAACGPCASANALTHGDGGC